ncbi:MAG: TatD family nuclease-associated radical SAM protein [Oscillospiraceae bacterium]|nr:TatD family nuclease-associated radical SAM protein [Oscillospiraceae bacterium]
MASIVYAYGENLYINLTNDCPCACVFCVRQKGEGLGSAESLWLEKEPTLADVKQALRGWNLADFAQVVFCGYGEPTCALSLLLRVCKYLRSLRACPQIRLNTNGLSDLINGKPAAPLFAGLVDSVSISMNAPTAEEYVALCKPQYGLEAFPAIFRFAAECKRFVPRVRFTAVDVIGEEKLALCRALAENVDIELCIRKEQ